MGFASSSLRSDSSRRESGRGSRFSPRRRPPPARGAAGAAGATAARARLRTRASGESRPMIGGVSRCRGMCVCAVRTGRTHSPRKVAGWNRDGFERIRAFRDMGRTPEPAGSEPTNGVSYVSERRVVRIPRSVHALNPRTGRSIRTESAIPGSEDRRAAATAALRHDQLRGSPTKTTHRGLAVRRSMVSAADGAFTREGGRARPPVRSGVQRGALTRANRRRGRRPSPASRGSSRGSRPRRRRARARGPRPRGCHCRGSG